MVTASVEARARYLVEAYPDLLAHRDKLDRAIDGLKPFHAKTWVAEWHAMAEAGRWHDLAAALVTHHYDPAYNRARKRRDAGPRTVELAVDRLDPAGFATAAERIRQAARRLAPTPDR